MKKENNKTSPGIADSGTQNLEYLWAAEKYKQSGIVLHEGGVVVECNQGFSDITGYSSEEARAMQLSLFFSDESFPKVKEYITTGNQQPLDATGLHKNGKEIPLQIETREVVRQNRRVNLTLLRDLNQLSPAEESAIISGLYYKALVEQAADAFFIHDFDGRIIEVNNKTCEMLGYSREELLNMLVTDIETDFSLGQARKQWSMVKPGQPFSLTGHHRRKDGTVFPVEVNFGCSLWKGERIFLVLSRDISQQLEAEEKLRQSEEKFRQIVEGSPDPIFIQTDDNFAYLNPAACELLGICSPEEIAGKKVKDLIHRDYHKRFDELVSHVNGKTLPERKLSEFKILPENRSAVRIEAKAEPVTFDGKNGILFFVRDITKRKESERQLKKMKTTFETAIASMADAVFISDVEGRFLHFNEAFAKIHRFRNKEECAKTLQEYPAFLEACTPDGAPVPVENWTVSRALKGETATDVEYRLKRKDTGESWIGSYSFSPIRDEEGQIVGSVVVGRDITEQRRAERELKEQEKLLRLIIENLPVGVLIADKEGRLVITNKEVNRIWAGAKYRSFENYGKYKAWRTDTGKRLETEDWAIARALRKGETSVNEELIIECFDGSNKTILNSAIPILDSDNEIRGAIAVNQDITLSKQAEEAMKQAQIATESARFKQSFLANMSHEIRTPLTGIMGMIGILQQTSPTEEQKEYINILKSSGENLREIINQILDLSKIEAGKVRMNYTRFEFETILKNAQKLFRGVQKKDVVINVESDWRIPRIIQADMSRISQVINNLVSNAIKFTEKGEIKITGSLVSYSPDQQQMLVKITVKDTGIGITPEMQKNIFNPFIQAGDGDFLTGSTGLGLTISQELVRLHGGEMGLESTPGKGSSFWFTFNAKAVDSQPSDILQESKDSLAIKENLKILLVEDNVVNQKVFDVILRYLGHEVVIAPDGQKAVDVFEPGKFDLVLMDINMPVMDGVAATRTLKDLYPDMPPIVGLSANAIEGDREKYLSLGMDEYLTKPLIEEEFNEVLKKLFR